MAVANQAAEADVKAHECVAPRATCLTWLSDGGELLPAPLSSAQGFVIPTHNRLTARRPSRGQQHVE